MAGILDGVRIVEWAQFHAGPGGTLMLGDMGAEVIKIEQPKIGDLMRGLMDQGGLGAGSQTRRMVGATSSISFETSNRNKKSITLDLSKEAGREVIYKLIQTADAFMQNWRPGVAQKMKMDYATLSQYNPKLIYCNVTGQGPKGPDAWRRGQDFIGLARSSLLTAPLPEVDEPTHFTAGIADNICAMMVAYGLLAALLARERGGTGQELHVSISGAALCLQQFRLGNFFLLGEEERRSRRRARNPIVNHFKCQDGKWVAISGTAQNVVYPDVCKAIGREDLITDPRFSSSDKRAENSTVLVEVLDSIFATKTRAEWLEVLKPWRRIMHTPVNDPQDLPLDPMITENEYVVDYNHPILGPIKEVGFPVMFTKTPCAIQGPAPQLGEHTAAVLSELGYSQAEIGKLKQEEVI